MLQDLSPTRAAGPLVPALQEDILMTKRKTLSLAFAGSLVVSVTLATPGLVKAQSETILPAPPRENSAGPQTEPATGKQVVSSAPLPENSPTLSITPAQLDAFADLVDGTTGEVQLRLIREPGLAPLVKAAADARMARKRLGKDLTIAGVSILGAGAIAGLGVVLMTGAICFDAACQSNVDQGTHIAEIIVLVAAGIGLALAVPGIVEMARHTDIETEAAERYQGPVSGLPLVLPPAESPAHSTGPSGKSLSLPLLSFTF